MTKQEKEAIQKEIDSLQARLDEQVDTPTRRTPMAGDVYETGTTVCISTCDGSNTLLESQFGGPGAKGSFDSLTLMERGEFLGTFDEVYIRKDKLKDNFMKMQDSSGDCARVCKKYHTSFMIRPDDMESFIDNLCAGNNADGTPIKE